MEISQIIDSWATYQYDVSDVEVFQESDNSTKYAFYKDGHFVIRGKKVGPTSGWMGEGERLKRILEGSNDWTKVTPPFEIAISVMEAYSKGRWER
jgi:hypothetical protein